MENIKLTRPQKMLLGWAAINNERGDDGTLRIEGKSTLVKNSLVAKGIARRIDGSGVSQWGHQYITKDWYIKPEYEPLCHSLKEYAEVHDTPTLGPSNLTPEEWNQVAG